MLKKGIKEQETKKKWRIEKNRERTIVPQTLREKEQRLPLEKENERGKNNLKKKRGKGEPGFRFDISARGGHESRFPCLPPLKLRQDSRHHIIYIVHYSGWDLPLFLPFTLSFSLRLAHSSFFVIGKLVHIFNPRANL